MILCELGVTGRRKGSCPTWVLTTLVAVGSGGTTHPASTREVGDTGAGKMSQARPPVGGPCGLGQPRLCPKAPTHLAQGLIFRASPRLMQKPAPPVANQKWTGRCGRGHMVRLPDPSPQAAGTPPAPPRSLGAGLCGRNTHHLALADPLCGLDGPVQAGLAEVDVLRVRVAGQQLQQGPHVHVVIIIHVAEPPAGRQGRQGGAGGGDCQGRSQPEEGTLPGPSRRPALTSSPIRRSGHTPRPSCRTAPGGCGQPSS